MRSRAIRAVRILQFLLPVKWRRSILLRELRIQLLLQRKWSYLRYLHLREGLIAAHGVTSVLSVGAGRGIAELALAVEFPTIRFRITDIESDRTPHYQHAQTYAKRWGVRNVDFGILDTLEPFEERYDMVASVEVIEHIQDDDRAVANMCEAASRFVFCLVPFADDASLNDPKQKERVWRRHQHYRFGYSSERLQQLFGDIEDMRGCYWSTQGFEFRQALSALPDREIRSGAERLAEFSRADITHQLPKSLDEAQGIWVLARSNVPPG